MSNLIFAIAWAFNLAFFIASKNNKYSKAVGVIAMVTCIALYIEKFQG